MDKLDDSVSGAKNKSAFLESLGNRLTNLSLGASLGNRYARFSRWLVGVDPRVLARCSKAQQTLYSATAIIMIVAALLTAAGVSSKLAALWGAGTIVTIFLFCAVLALVLAMEAAVLASISPTANPWTTIAVRVPIGLLLVAMQVLPTLTSMLSARLDLALHEQNLSQQTWTGENPGLQALFASVTPRQQAQYALVVGRRHQLGGRGDGVQVEPGNAHFSLKGELPSLGGCLTQHNLIAQAPALGSGNKC